MIFEGSRYENADVTMTLGADGVPRTVVGVPPGPTAGLVIPYFEYVLRSGDRIDVLAARYLNDAELWWRIADLNPEFLFWETLPGGVVIRIPNG